MANQAGNPEWKPMEMEAGNKNEVPAMNGEEEETFVTKGLKLVACFIGLQASYVTWGVLQEFVMTKSYGSAMFPSAVFLVFSNRLTAMLVASCIVAYKSSKNQFTHKAPFHYYAPSSISNVTSSWAQYQALAYVDFPTQTLFKSSKIIPVMLVGKYLHGKTYEWIEYGEAIVITCGIATFMLSQGNTKHKDANPENASMYTLGIMLLCVYVLADSFTSQWQSRVFKEFKVDQFQMMFGVNFFSICFTSLSLIFSGEGESYNSENHDNSLGGNNHFNNLLVEIVRL